MKRRTAVLATALITMSIILAQAGNAKPQTTDGSKQDVSATSPALTEAERLNQQVVQLYSEKRFDEALPLAKRALQLREAQLGREHQLVADALFNLASIQMAKKNYREAESLYSRALKIYEKALGADSLKISNVLDELAWLRYYFGSTGEAVSMLERALAIREKALGPTHKEVARSLSSLTAFHQQTGEYSKAVSFCQRSLAALEKSLGPSNKEVGELMDKCACAMLQNRQGEEAHKLMTRAWRILHPSETDELNGMMPEEVISGKVLSKPAPAYPERAKRARVQGVVVVYVVVDESGRVIEAKAKCGHPLLREASEQAARQARFSVTTLKGRPVKVSGVISYNYVLR